MISRVHWLLHELPSTFKMKYNISFDYEFHNYVFYRNYGYRSPRIKEFFSINRTSKRCFRLFYFNDFHGKNIYKSFSSFARLCEFMVNLSELYGNENYCDRSSTWVFKKIDSS